MSLEVWDVSTVTIQLKWQSGFLFTTIEQTSKAKVKQNVITSNSQNSVQ